MAHPGKLGEPGGSPPEAPGEHSVSPHEAPQKGRVAHSEALGEPAWLPRPECVAHPRGTRRASPPYARKFCVVPRPTSLLGPDNHSRATAVPAWRGRDKSH